MNNIGRAARVFGSFWWDFLVGDTPELFIAALLIIVVALLLRHDHVLAVIVLPVMAGVSLLASVLHGRKK